MKRKLIPVEPYPFVPTHYNNHTPVHRVELIDVLRSHNELYATYRYPGGKDEDGFSHCTIRAREFDAWYTSIKPPRPTPEAVTVPYPTDATIPPRRSRKHHAVPAPVQDRMLLDFSGF